MIAQAKPSKVTKKESLNELFSYMRPGGREKTLDWLRLNARNTDGRPYSHDFYPHLGAPGGPCDAMDDAKIRKVWLQFGSRLGKTFLGQCCLMKKADNNPGPMMFASSVEKVAGEVIERTYQMLESSPKVSPQLRPKGRRRRHCIDFSACQCFVAWSRSVSTLADKEVEYGHANEIDKWEHASTSKEADPLKLFLDRFKNRPHHKIILESTPTVKGKSRIEAGRLQSTNCQFYVPCPHCWKYQRLTMDNLTWEHLPNGRSDSDLARRTAIYTCHECKTQISDHERLPVLRLGVWCPAGCTIKDEEAKQAAIANAAPPGSGSGYEWSGWDNASWVDGSPHRNGIDAGYQLSSLYASSLSWGDIAAEFVSCANKPQNLRNFINQWLAETWEQTVRKTTWERLAETIISKEVRREVVPEWASLLTIGIDRQEDCFPWVIDAWGPDNKCATIHYGEAFTFEEIDSIATAQYQHSDGGDPLKIAFGLFDSGFRPDGVYEFCKSINKKGLQIYPSKGSNQALETDFRQVILGANTAMPGMVLFHVDTIRSQLWLESQLTAESSTYCLFDSKPYEHQDFLEQLLNDISVMDMDSSNNCRERWERKDTNIPNDFRDCRRYSYIARLIALRGQPVKPRTQKEEARRRTAIISTGISRPDGRTW